jgi:serine protease Do
MLSAKKILSTTTLSDVLRVSAVLGLVALMVPASGALQAAVTPLGPAQLPEALLDAPSRIMLAGATQGYLGVTVHDVDPARAEKEKLPNALGAEVVSLDHDAPAAKAGVHTGDIIQAINGQIVSDTAALTRMLRDMPVGKLVELQIVHNAKIERVHLQLADRAALVQHAWAHHFHVPIPEPAPIVNTFAGQGTIAPGGPDVDGNATDSQAYIGAQVEPLTPQLAKFFGVRAGNGLLVRAVEDKSPAGLAGLDAGDVILSANGMPLETAADWMQTLRANAGHPVPIVVLRNRKRITLAITVDSRITQSELVLPEQLQKISGSPDRCAL